MCSDSLETGEREESNHMIRHVTVKNYDLVTSIIPTPQCFLVNLKVSQTCSGTNSFIKVWFFVLNLAQSPQGWK